MRRTLSTVSSACVAMPSQSGIIGVETTPSDYPSVLLHSAASVSSRLCRWIRRNTAWHALSFRLASNPILLPPPLFRIISISHKQAALTPFFMKTSEKVGLVMAMFCAASTTVFSAATVEEKTVGPAAPDAKYVVSPRGVHLATVARKGSRVAVVLDGVDGPRFDEILTPQLPWVDPRGPAEEARLVGTIAINLYPLGPVTFSKDGNRFAYLARLSKEWVLMADNKEVLRIPVDNIADMRLQFTGNDGKHLLFAHAIYGGYELWGDGQKWPGLFGSGGGGSEGAIDPPVSPEGTQIAYLATMDQRGAKRALTVHG